MLCGKQRRNDSPIFAHLSLSDILAALCQGWALVAKYTALTSCKDTHKHTLGIMQIVSKRAGSDLITVFPTWSRIVQSHLRYLGKKLMVTMAATSISTGMHSRRNASADKTLLDCTDLSQRAKPGVNV